MNEQPPKIFFKKSYRSRPETLENMRKAILADEDIERRATYIRVMRNIKKSKLRNGINSGVRKIKNEFLEMLDAANRKKDRGKVPTSKKTDELKRLHNTKRR